MLYQMQEGYLTLEGEWKDQSVNLLVPGHFEARGVNLVVARDVIPDGTAFDDYIVKQKENLGNALVNFELTHEVSGRVEARPAHFMEFRWNNDGTVCNQMMSVISLEDHVLSITATMQGEIDEKARETLFSAMRSFKTGTAKNSPGGAVS